MNEFTIILLCLMGLCWGSFLNVLLVRTLSGESIIFPFSKCPKCNHPLYWWQNIPLLSFFLLKGKCYFCNKTISPRYVLVEIFGLLLFWYSFKNFVSIFDAVSVIMIVSMFLVMSYTDYKARKISPYQAYIAILFALIFGRYDIYGGLAGAFAGAIFILTLILIGRQFFRKETFGNGDIYLFGTLGAVVGIKSLPIYMLYVLFIQFLLILPKYVMNLIRYERIKTLRYLIFFCVTCLFLYFLKDYNHVALNVVFILLLGCLLFFAYKLIRDLIDIIKMPQNESYCPLAPAIAISCLLFLC